MKKITLPLFAIALFISCRTNDKMCEEWMEGDDCKTEIRSKYFGGYQCTNVDPKPGQTINVGFEFLPGRAINELAIRGMDGSRFILNTPTQGTFTIAGDWLWWPNCYFGNGSGGQFKNDSLYLHFILVDSITNEEESFEYACEKR